MRLGNYWITRSLFRIVCIGVALTVGTQEGWAQQDLGVAEVYASTDADGNILTCPSKICVTLYSNQLGPDNWQIPRDEVIVKFFSMKDGGQPQDIDHGEILVTWADGDGGLGHNYWPTDFQSGPNSCVKFSPSSPGDYRFRAEVVYAADQASGNNRLDSLQSYSLAECPPGRCVFIGGNVICRDGHHVEPPIHPCMLCGKLPGFAKPDPGGFPGLHDFCPEFCKGGGLPFSEFVSLDQLVSMKPLEVLFNDRENGLNVAIVTSTGRKVAGMEPLRRPIREGGQAYTQRLRLKPTRGETYFLVYWPSPKTKLNVNLPFPIHVRQGKSGK